ncbi:glycosyltransferase [bacterium]|nr:glycosyltransferase [bacterium]NIN91437.1 glycosyltransferase [bacterium]NIO17847.1 glycosyltransferase [bacterium]NIO72828.1 glycosyltransferase [bacterium]
MKLSVIMPVFNEESTILKIIDRVRKVDIDKQIVIVDDGSIDRTREILENLSDEDIKVIYHAENRGKGSAIRTAIPYLEGEVTVIQDADLEYDPQEYHKLVRPIIDGKASIVYGSRFLQFNKPIYLRYLLGNKFLTWLINILYCSRITDSYTCYKAFETGVLKNLTLGAKRFEFEAEVTIKLLKKGYEIREVPISYSPRTLREGKKINWKDALSGILTILKYRLGK